MRPASGKFAAERVERFVGDVADEDAGAVAGEPRGNRQADAAGPRGDQNTLSTDTFGQIGAGARFSHGSCSSSQLNSRRSRSAMTAPRTTTP